MEKKTTFQNWVDENYSTQANLLSVLNKKKVSKATQHQLSRDYNHKNGLEKISKYAKLLKLKSVEYHGFDYGCEISGTLKIT